MPKPKTHRKVIRQELFWPTPVWHTQIWDFMRSQTRVTFNEDMTSWVLGKIEKEKSVNKSNKGGWQSDMQNPNEELEPLSKEIFDFCKTLNLDIKNLTIQQMWINVNKKGDWNAIHQHGGYYDLSGIYYIKTPKNCGRLVFRDPRTSAIGNSFMVKKFDKGEIRYFNVMEGTLMLWPSFLEHYVEPSQADDERISVSFDINVDWRI